MSFGEFCYKYGKSLSDFEQISLDLIDILRDRRAEDKTLFLLIVEQVLTKNLPTIQAEYIYNSVRKLVDEI